MTLVKHSPFRYSKNHFGFNSLFDEIFNNNLSNFVGSDTATSTPAVNVSETDKAYNIEVAAPGYNNDDLNVNLENNLLTIEGKHEEKSETKEDGKVNRREFSYGSFKRSFKLPREVDHEKISASYTNGILNISVPKTEKEQNKTRKIAIS